MQTSTIENQQIKDEEQSTPGTPESSRRPGGFRRDSRGPEAQRPSNEGHRACGRGDASNRGKALLLPLTKGRLGGPP
jgi:hypothetical protein